MSDSYQWPEATLPPPNRYDGSHGTALRILDRKNFMPNGTCCESYLVYAPGHSVAWDHYLISVVHLREHKGIARATKRFPQATHEMIQYALDPAQNPVPENCKSLVHLIPINVVWQFVATDDEAIKLCFLLAAAAADGRMYMEPEGINGAKEHWATVMKLILPNTRIE